MHCMSFMHTACTLHAHLKHIPSTLHAQPTPKYTACARQAERFRGEAAQLVEKVQAKADKATAAAEAKRTATLGAAEKRSAATLKAAAFKASAQEAKASKLET